MIDQLNLVLWSWIEGIRGIRERRIWPPLLAVMAVQTCVLLALVFFYEPVLSWFMAPVVRGMGTAQALHYPQLFLVLPGLFSRAGIWIDWLLGSFFFGVVTVIIWRTASGAAAGDPWSRARASWGRLLLVRLPSLLFAVFLLFVLPQILPSGEEELKGNALRFLRYGSFLLGALVEAILVYAPLAVVALGRPVGGAFRDTFRVLKSDPLATLLIVLVPNLIQLPISAALRRTDSMVRSLTPETVAWMVVLSIAIYGLVNYLIVASAVRVFGARLQGETGGRS